MNILAMPPLYNHLFEEGETLYEYIIFAISQLLVNLLETIKKSKKG